MLTRALGGALGGGAIAFTLMACYGMPPCADGTRDCYDEEADASARDDVTQPDVRVRDGAADGDVDDDAGDDAGDEDDSDAGDDAGTDAESDAG